MLINKARIDGEGPFDVRIDDGVVTKIAASIDNVTGECRLDADGGELIPGLHDHHIHLFATAAARRSVPCGPPAVRSRAALRARLTEASPLEGWIRAVGYDESVAGHLDRHALDALRADVPLRMQHRSGQAWFVNTAAIRALRLDECGQAGIERDEHGEITGRLYRCDDLLRDRLGTAPPSLRALGADLASKGVTAVTDATAANDAATYALFSAAIKNGELPQRLVLMGTADLDASTSERISIGAVKIVLDERALPAVDTLEREIASAHASARAVALHCVTRSELLLALAALETVGSRSGDRIEHAGVCPPECSTMLRDLGVTVVTQPGFIRERGDRYLAEVAGEDLEWLYPCGSLCDAGVAVGGSTDAPYAEPDPWAAMSAAVDRRTAAGVVLGENERISPERALALFTTHADDPGGRPRRVIPGAVADLCLLDRPWSQIRDRLDARYVRATIRAGEIIWSNSELAQPS